MIKRIIKTTQLPVFLRPVSRHGVNSSGGRWSSYDHRSAFTLVETIVAIGVFSITVSIALGGLVTALRTQRQVAAFISADNNVSLVLEQIAREARTGYDFCRPNSCPPGEIDFVNAVGVPVIYRLAGGAIERAEENLTNGTYTFSPLTGINVTVAYLNFVVFGNQPTDNWPPRITISIGISANSLGISSDVTNLQTTVSSRQMDALAP
ncbi:MAG TPA: type II secretion system protein [Candidatus Paceibacterota bacterium]|nr:type II secretion system protein [Candidatus Paceibacterota bacterium]